MHSLSLSLRLQICLVSSIRSDPNRSCLIPDSAAMRSVMEIRRSFRFSEIKNYLTSNFIYLGYHFFLFCVFVTHSLSLSLSIFHFVFLFALVSCICFYPCCSLPSQLLFEFGISVIIRWTARRKQKKMQINFKVKDFFFFIYHFILFYLFSPQ